MITYDRLSIDGVFVCGHLISFPGHFPKAGEVVNPGSQTGQTPPRAVRGLDTLSMFVEIQRRPLFSEREEHAHGEETTAMVVHTVL